MVLVINVRLFPVSMTYGILRKNVVNSRKAIMVGPRCSWFDIGGEREVASDYSRLGE